MTVIELINILKDLPDNLPVLVPDMGQGGLVDVEGVNIEGEGDDEYAVIEPLFKTGE